MGSTEVAINTPVAWYPTPAKGWDQSTATPMDSAKFAKATINSLINGILEKYANCPERVKIWRIVLPALEEATSSITLFRRRIGESNERRLNS